MSYRMNTYEYDIEADAFALSREKYDYAYSIEVNSELIIDVDSNKSCSNRNVKCI